MITCSVPGLTAHRGSLDEAILYPAGCASRSPSCATAIFVRDDPVVSTTSPDEVCMLGAGGMADANRIGRYEIVKHLGSGKSGSVYVAKAVASAGFERH